MCPVQIAALKGKQSTEFAETLGRQGSEEIVSRDNLALLMQEREVDAYDGSPNLQPTSAKMVDSEMSLDGGS
eukprot:SAG31_NODE_79_length_27235_cov_6.268868_14_plen_72_part_00